MILAEMMMPSPAEWIVDIGKLGFLGPFLALALWRIYQQDKKAAEVVKERDEIARRHNEDRETWVKERLADWGELKETNRQASVVMAQFTPAIADMAAAQKLAAAANHEIARGIERLIETIDRIDQSHRSLREQVAAVTAKALN
jgi:hypothetical protein